MLEIKQIIVAAVRSLISFPSVHTTFITAVKDIIPDGFPLLSLIEGSVAHFADLAR